MAGRVVPLFSAPTRIETEALTVTASYLKRAGNEASTRLLAAPDLGHGKVELISTIRDEMRDSAALCECLIALFEGWTISRL
jgi:hypothetical protein